MSQFFNDSPIETSEDDQYGISSFAKAIAKSIKEISAPVGTTIAINGAWGAGKSSAVNLIRNELQSASKTGLTVVDFKCWWYRGEEALTLAFFQELNNTLNISIGDKVKDLVPKLGKHILQAGPVLGAAVSLLPGGNIFAPFVSGGADFAKRFFPEGEPLEETFVKLSKVLKEQNERFLVIIDDIDRLSADEALAIFRLVKSVGRLPNVMYLLVFDRDLADAAVQQRYPSEGPHFLEKIIQASFELPAPISTDLNNTLLANFERICGHVEESEVVQFMNVFYDVVAPYLLTPRHVTRLINAINVTWPAISGEVNKADFMALETLRLYEPKLFSSIKSNKEIVTQTSSIGSRDTSDPNRFKPFTTNIEEARHEQVKTILQRIFPALENMHYDSSWNREWNAARRICVGKYFDTYFRLSLSDEALPAKWLEEIIEKAGDADFVKSIFKAAAQKIRKGGKTMVPTILDELNTHAKRFDKEKVTPFLSTLFSIVDEIDCYQDNDGAFSFGSTPMRVHWLIRRLTEGRFSIEERSTLYLTATENASLDWLIDFVDSAVRDYEGRDGESVSTPIDKCLVSQSAIPDFKRCALERLRLASANGQLLQCHNLLSNLYRWREFSDDNGAEMKAWLAATMKDDAVLVMLAKKLTSESWSHTLGDRVSRRSIRASISNDFNLFDPSDFKTELMRIVTTSTVNKEDIEAVNVFLTTWNKQESDLDID